MCSSLEGSLYHCSCTEDLDEQRYTVLRHHIKAERGRRVRKQRAAMAMWREGGKEGREGGPLGNKRKIIVEAMLEEPSKMSLESSRK